MIDPIEQSLDAHLNEMNKQDDYEGYLENVADKFYRELKAMRLVKVCGDHYSLDDFIADFEIDSQYFSSFLLGNSEALKEQAERDLYKYAQWLAKQTLTERL
jgi:hypothetical protein